MIRLCLALLLVSVCLIAGTAVALLVRPDWALELAQGGLHRYTELRVNWEHVERRLLPYTLELRGFRLENPDAQHSELVTFDSLVMELHDLPSLAKPFWSLQLHNGDIWFARDADGRSNWDIMPPGNVTDTPIISEDPPNAAFLPEDYNFDVVLLRRLKFHYVTPRQQRSLTIPEIRLERSAAQKGLLAMVADYRQQVFKLSADVTLPQPGQPGVALDITLEHPEIAATVSGTLHPLSGFSGSELKLHVSATDTKALEHLLETTIPAPAPLEIHGRLSQDGVWKLRDLKLGMAGAQFRGELDIDTRNDSFRADLHADTLDLSPLFPPAPSAIGTENKAPAESHEEAALDWALLNQWTGQVQLAAAEVRLPKLTLGQVQLDAQLERSLRVLLAADSIQGADPALPQQASATITFKPGGTTTLGVDGNLSLSAVIEDMQLEVEGPVNLNGLPGNELTLIAHSDSGAYLWRQLSQAPAVPQGFDLEALFRYAPDETLLDAALKLAGGSAELRLKGSPSRHYLQTSLLASGMDLSFLRGQQATAKPDPEQKTDKLFSSEPLTLDALQAYNADMDIRLSDIYVGGSHLRQLHLQPVLNRGVFSIDGGEAHLGEGKLLTDLYVDGSQQELSLRMGLELQNLTTEDLAMASAGGFSGGKIDATVTVQSIGATPAALAANSEGEVMFTGRDIVAHNGNVNLVGSDLLAELVGKLNPFVRKEPTTAMECVSLQVTGAKGQWESDKALIVETDKMRIVGTGKIDLGKERLSLSFSPVARKGLGINLSSLVQLAKLGGTLTQPKVTVSASGLLSTGLSTAAASATGGLSVLAENLIKRAVSAASPCSPDTKEKFVDPTLPTEPPAGSEQPG